MVRRHPLLPAAATPREPRTQPQAFPRGPSGPWSHAYHGPGDPPPRAPDGTTSATARTQPKWAPPHSPCEHTHIGPGDARRADDGPARPGGDACCRAGGQHGALPVLGGIPGTCAVPLTTLDWPACMPAAHRRRPAFRPLDESLRGLQKREKGSGLQTNTSYGSLTLYINKGFPTLFNTPNTRLLTATPGTSRAHRMRPHVSTPDRVRPRMPLSDHKHSPRAAYANQKYTRTFRHAHRMRPHVSLPSPPDRVRPRMPLSDHMYMHMYSSETAYTNQNISHTLRHAEGFARHDPSRRSCITGFNDSLRAGTCIAPIAPQPSMPPSDRRMPPSDPTKRLRTRSPPSTARPAGRHPCRRAQPTPRPSRSTRTHSTDPRPASLSTALRHGHSLAVRPQIPTQCMMLIPCARAHPPLANHPDPNERCRPPRVGTASPAPP